MPYDNNLTGILSRNDRRQKDTHPEYTGQCEIDGKQFWISAFLKTAGPQSKTPGRKFFSLSFKPKDQQPARPQQQPPAQSAPPQRERQAELPGTSAPSRHADLQEDVPF